jgi:hypothetical protein
MKLARFHQSLNVTNTHWLTIAILAFAAKNLSGSLVGDE